MNKVLSELARVLKKDKYCVIIIGSNSIQTGGILLENEVEKIALKYGLVLDKKLAKPIKGIRNVMRNEYILFFRKVRSNA